MRSYEEIYNEVKLKLSEKRFYHSVCTMQRAVEYANIYGEDEEISLPTSSFGTATIVITDAQGNDVTNVTRLPAGTYTVTATVAGTDDYSALTDTSTLTVAKANATVSVDDVKITEPSHLIPLSDFDKGFVIIKKGKKVFHKIIK